MTSLQPFLYGTQKVRTILVDGEPWFVLNDLCTILNITNVGNVLARIDDEDKSSIRLTDGTPGNPNRSIVSEAGMFDVIVRSDSPNARPFQKWVTHEVLPAIRKTGAYGTPALPRTYAEALRELADTAERNEALELEAKANAPKVLFADSVATSKTSILVGDLAKILKGNGVDVGANRLFEWLRNDGYLIRRKGTDWNMPTQRSMDLGLFEIKETAVSHSDGHITVNKTPKVTGKGQTYFINRYLPQKGRDVA